MVFQRVFHILWRLEIEPGRVMRFVLTPTNKLPEALSAFDPKTGSLFSGKFFSAHTEIGFGEDAMDQKGIKGWEAYVEDWGWFGRSSAGFQDWYHLFDCYFFTKSAAGSVRKIFALCEALRGPDVEQLAPLHGPVVREQCWKLMAWLVSISFEPFSFDLTTYRAHLGTL